MLSHLFKLYERHLLIFATLSVNTMAEQCGGRAGFGSHTLLKRLQLIMQYAETNKMDIYLAAIDVKEAYERVWRVGIMYRLWEAGIRGKLWRVIDDILTNTFARVRTNFGITSAFRTEVGIVLGGLLSAFLFIVFFDPISKACSKISPTINSIKLNIMLYMDDGTSIALTEQQRHDIMLHVLKWADRWNITISIIKSAYLTITYSPFEQQVAKRILKEVESIKIVGLTLYKGGLHPPPAIRDILSKVGIRADTLLSSTHGPPLRFDVLAFLYDKYSLSILAHSRPFIHANSYTAQSFQKAQDRFVLDALKLTTSTSPLLAASELGIYDFDLTCSRDALLLHYKLANNDKDTITPGMLTWKTTPDLLSAHEIAQRELLALGISSSISYLLKHNYPTFKQLIKNGMHSEQQRRYKAYLQICPFAHRHLVTTKPLWGIDKALLLLPVKEAITIISFRLSSFRPATASPTNPRCALCPAPFTSMEHTLWACMGHSVARDTLYETLRLAHTGIFGIFNPLSPSAKTSYILGGGLTTLQIPHWVLVLRVITSFLSAVEKRSAAAN